MTYDDEEYGEELPPARSPRTAKAETRRRPVPRPPVPDTDDEFPAEDYDDEGAAETVTVRPTARTQPPATRAGTAARPQYSGSRSSRISRPVVQAAPAPTRQIPRLAVLLGVIAVLLALIIALIVTKPTGTSAVVNNGGTAVPAADVAATINGKPILKADYQERLLLAQQDYTDQYGLKFDTSETGKRMADVLGFDVLDQMINFEVLQQEAAKEQLIPNPTQVQQRYDEAQAAAKKANQTWEQFLKSQNIKSDAEFRQSIVEGFTYLIIADKHTTNKTGTNDQKTAELATYICATRARYDVKINIKFIVEQAPCSSANSPSDGPAPGITVPAQTQLPAPVETFAPGPPLAATPKK